MHILYKCLERATEAESSAGVSHICAADIVKIFSAFLFLFLGCYYCSLLPHSPTPRSYPLHLALIVTRLWATKLCAFLLKTKEIASSEF